MAIFTGPPQKAAHFFGQLRGDVGSRFSHAKVEWTRMDHAAAAAWLAVFFLAFQEILFFWNLEIPSIIVGKVVGFPGSTPNFQVSFSTETHVPLNRDEKATIWTINLMAAWSPTLWLQSPTLRWIIHLSTCRGRTCQGRWFRDWHGMIWNAPCAGHHYIV